MGAFKRIVEVSKQLPSPPEVCLSIANTCRDQDTSIDDLQGMVEGDIALSGRLLHVANSAFFGVREPVTSVRRAISLLGFGMVKTLALGFFLDAKFGRLSLEGLPYTDLPQYAAAGSAVAETVAKRAAPDLADEAAALGLLHESGTMVMAMAFGADYDAMVAKLVGSEQTLEQAELEVFGIDHAAAGKVLLRGWRLQDAFVQAVASHHQAEMGEQADRRARMLWKIIVVASDLALLFCGSDRSKAAPKALAVAKRQFDWDAGEVAEVVKAASPAYRDRIAVFSTPVADSEADCQAAMEAAVELREQAKFLLGVGEL